MRSVCDAGAAAGAYEPCERFGVPDIATEQDMHLRRFCELTLGLKDAEMGTREEPATSRVGKLFGAWPRVLQGRRPHGLVPIPPPVLAGGRAHRPREARCG